jgi:hypothetical protein
LFNRPVLYGINFDIQQSPLEEWVFLNTPKDAVFLIPPDYQEFSVNSKRASVVTWVNVAHRGKDYLEWYDRVVTVTGGAVTIESADSIDDARVISQMAKEGYERLAPDAIVHLAGKYRAPYCISARELPFEALFRSATYSVYRIPGQPDGTLLE